MKLKVELTPIERFDVKINGVSIGTFEKESSWEGLTKLKGKDGLVIIEDDNDFITALFKGVFDHSPSEHNVYKITPSLIPTDINENKNNEIHSKT